MNTRNKLLGLLVLACVGNTWALDANEAAGASQDDFKTDFLVYSFTWQPTFCIMKPTTPGCDQPPQAFLSHGLWPYSKSEGEFTNRHPQFCTTSPSCDQDACEMPSSQMQAVLDNKPLRALVTKEPKGMFAHEWKKHGTCSGMAMQDYFQEMVRLSGVKKFAKQKDFEAMIGKQRRFSEIKATFPENTAFRCYRDTKGQQYLHEVFYLIRENGEAYLDEKNLEIGVQCAEQATFIPASA